MTAVGRADAPWTDRAEAYRASAVHARGASLKRLLALAVPRPGERAVDESALATRLNAWYERLERTRDPDHRRLRDADAWRAALLRAGFADPQADADTSERIVVADWLDRVGAGTEQRDAVHALLRDAPDGADAALCFERAGPDGDVVAFAMPMVVAIARVPDAPERAQEEAS